VQVAVSVTDVFGTGNAVDAVSVQTGAPAAGCAGDWPAAQNTIGLLGLPNPSGA
jgi:hypothetical protein